MVAKKPKIVIVGAGMAGLTAANKLYTCTSSKDLFELCVVEGGSRIGGRINTSEFGGDRIEMGATWIHGIGGSPIHKIAQEIRALDSDKPWECMDGFLDDPKTVAEGGFEVNPSVVGSISSVFENLMEFAQGKVKDAGFHRLPANGGGKISSVGGFLRTGLDAYWESVESEQEVGVSGNWSRKLLEEAVFEMHENNQRTYTSAGDLKKLDFDAESEYRMFPGEEITIAQGYLSIIKFLASALPPDLIKLGKKVQRIEWKPEEFHQSNQNGHMNRPVKLHFCDGSAMAADHVIVTVSLGVLKAGIRPDSGMFDPPLPSFKTEAISRLGFGVVNKLFLQLNHDAEIETDSRMKFPFLQMAFHPKIELRHEKIPWWMRKTASICPIYRSSSVLLSWFAGEEALELESLSDEEILSGVSTTISNFLPSTIDSHRACNGRVNGIDAAKLRKVLTSKWGNDPLFLGSYSYIAVGSSGDDMDTLAEPLPRKKGSSLELQILFAGEATHRTHYSTTHGAYFSGLREANRLLQHYDCNGV